MSGDASSVRGIIGEGAPLQSPTFGLVCAALAIGLKPAQGNWLLDTLDGYDPTKRSFCWVFDPESKAPVAGELITLKELSRRWHDDAWLAAHDDHPIAYMQAMWSQMLGLRADLKGRKSDIRFEKKVEDAEGVHLHVAVITDGMTPEEKADIIRRFEEAG